MNNLSLLLCCLLFAMLIVVSVKVFFGDYGKEEENVKENLVVQDGVTVLPENFDNILPEKHNDRFISYPAPVEDQTLDLGRPKFTTHIRN